MNVLLGHALNLLNGQLLVAATSTRPTLPETGVGIPGPMTFLITGLCLSVGCFFIGRFYSRIKRRPLLAKLAYLLMLLVAIATSVGASWAMKQQRRRAARQNETRQIAPVRSWEAETTTAADETDPDDTDNIVAPIKE